MAAILIAFLVGVVIVFSIARILFGAALAVLLAGVVGACFGGPPGGGAGIVVGLILVPVTSLLGLLIEPTDQ
jgi:hypothetical protein